MNGQLTLEQALQNIDNTLRQVQTNLDTHAALQGSLQLIRQTLTEQERKIEALLHTASPRGRDDSQRPVEPVGDLSHSQATAKAKT